MELRITSILLLCFLSLNGVLLLSLNGCAGSSTSTKQAGSGPLEHVLVIFQENRTPDNLFHGLPNADIANSGLNSLGQTNPSQPL
jgi:phospholipase C